LSVRLTPNHARSGRILSGPWARAWPTVINLLESREGNGSVSYSGEYALVAGLRPRRVMRLHEAAYLAASTTPAEPTRSVTAYGGSKSVATPYEKQSEPMSRRRNRRALPRRLSVSEVIYRQHIWTLQRSSEGWSPDIRSGFTDRMDRVDVSATATAQSAS
jgi:hypothetical protein